MLPDVWTRESYEHAAPEGKITEQLWKIQVELGTVNIVVMSMLSVKVFAATLL